MNLTPRTPGNLTPRTPGDLTPGPGGEVPRGSIALLLLLAALLIGLPARAEEAPWWLKLRWTWIAAGLTAGSATAAVFAGVHANELEDRYHAALDASRAEPQPASTVLALGDRARGQATLSSVLWGVAGAGAITGAVLAWLELTAPDSAGRVYVAPAPLPGGAALSFGGRLP